MIPENEPIPIELPSEKTKIKKPVFISNKSKKGKQLFNSKSLEFQTEVYDILPQTNKPQKKPDSPRLLALRNKTAKSKIRPTTNLRKTNLIVFPDASEGMPSLLSNTPSRMSKKRPLSSVEMVQRSVELERQSLMFSEDPIAYFSKCKDGSGHRFIYLNYLRKREDPCFSPYELTKVPFSEIEPEYFTMSTNGVTRIKPDGDTEHVSLDEWAKESSIFLSIRKLQMFSKFYYWKPFLIWKTFVMKQRYAMLKRTIIEHPLFSNACFFSSTIKILETSAKGIIMKYLLPFTPEKKYSLQELIQTTEENHDNLKKEYLKFISGIAKELFNINALIGDPKRLVILESDFPEIKRKNPNIEQLKLLENKINEEKVRRVKMIEAEIQNLADYVLQTDYILLESLSESCVKCWEFAVSNVKQDMSSIFQIDVSLTNEGEVKFTPNLEELISAIEKILDDSISIVNSLPRILLYETIVPILKVKYHDVQKLIDKGPTFEFIIKGVECFNKTKKEIISQVTNMYNKAIVHCQLFKEYFPIYHLEKTWDPEAYGRKRGGTSVRFEFEGLEGDTKIVFDPSEQIIVDFQSVRRDIEQFNRDITKMSHFKSCIVHGALFVDSRNLKSLLNPIPTTSLERIRKYLNNIVMTKIDFLLSIFRACSRKMKKEPPNLEQYVEFCEFFKSVTDLTPYITQEISFIDNMLAIFDSEGFATSNNLELTMKNLHDDFKMFKSDQGSAALTKELNEDKYMMILYERMRQCDAELSELDQQISKCPPTIDECDTSKYVKESKKITMRINDMNSELVSLQHCQQVLKVNFNSKVSYDDIYERAVVISCIYKIIDSWKEFKLVLSTTPFNQIDMERFCKNLEKLDDEARNLSKEQVEIKTNLLNEVISNLDKVVPYIPQFRMLYSGKMKPQHWMQLFDECGQSGNYTPQIKISDLMALKIFDEKEKIQKITLTSKGESKLIKKFNKIKDHWAEVKLPLLEGQIRTDDSLLLGDTDSLFDEIKKSQVSLQKMLEKTFVHVIKKDLLELSKTLGFYATILDLWKKFQANWVILRAFFSLEGTTDILPDQSALFTMVRRRWMALVKHTPEGSTLVHVSSFPSLLQYLQECNANLENILGSISDYINHRRMKLPRLFFLSDIEVLTLLSTPHFKVFASNISKVMMRIKDFDIQMKDMNENSSRYSNMQNFTNLIVIGLLGDNAEVLTLENKVNCTINNEDWITKVMSSMNESLKISFIKSYNTFGTMPLTDWLMTITTYVASLVLYCAFTRDIEDCFANIDNNSKVFINYEELLNKRITELSNSMTSPLEQNELQKISVMITILQEQVILTRLFAEKVPNFSQRINWKHHLKLRFDSHTKKIMAEIDDYSIEHGYEYWGSFRPAPFTNTTKKIIASLARSIMTNSSTYLFGAQHTGKKELIDSVAAIFGQFIFTIPSFSQGTEFDLYNAFIGAALTGNIVQFADIQNYSKENLTKIFEEIRKFASRFISSESSILIQGKKYDFNKKCTFLLTGSEEPYIKPEKFPSQLFSILKPVAIAEPDCMSISEIKLAAYGFKSTKYLSNKLLMTLDSVKTLYPKILSTSTVGMINSIVVSSSSTLRFLMQSNSVPFIKYSDAARTTEEYCVARGIYTHFKDIIHKCNLDMLLKIIYSHFMIFEDFSHFKSNVTINKYFLECPEMSAIKKYLQKEIPETKISKYLIDKTIALHNMLKNYSTVIIVGPPQSGKSTILEYLNKLYSYENPDFSSVVPNRKPIKLHEVYFASDEWNKMFGTRKNGKWEYGEVHACLTNLAMYQKTHMQFLKFDGPITEELSTLIGSISNGNTLTINTYEKYRIDDGLRIIIETSDISKLTPSTIGRVGILPMENIFISDVVENVTKECRTFYPELLFDTTISHLDYSIPETSIATLKKLFIQIAPTVINYIYHTENHICFSKNSTSTENGNAYLSASLPRYVIKLCISYIELFNSEISNEEQLKIVLIMSFFIVYMSVISPSQINMFDTWIRSTFIIEIPGDWINLNVPDHFWDIYPRPSLLSMRFYKGKLIPLDFRLLSIKPIVTERKATPGIVLASDVGVCTAQFLPPLFYISMALRRRENILLHGNRLCGKSTFLKFLFEINNETSPIYVPITQLSTRESIINYIQFHTKLIAKDYTMDNSQTGYTLIFDNVMPENIHAVEFIREIIKNPSLPQISPKDPKYYESISVRFSSIIVVTSTLEGFSGRFLSLFLPVLVTDPQPKTVKYIFEGVGKKCGLSPRIVSPLYQLYEAMIAKKKINFHFSHLLDILTIYDQRAAKTENNFNCCIKTILAEFNFLGLYRSGASSFLQENFNNVFSLEQQRQLFDTVLNEKELYYAEISQNPDEHQLTVHVRKHQVKGVTNMLNEFLSSIPQKLPFTFVYNQVIIWSHLQRAISYPTGNCILVGPPGSGRYQLARFTAYQKGFKFISLDKVNLDTTNIEKIKEIMTPLILGVIQKETYVVFLRGFTEKEIKNILYECIYSIYDSTSLTDIYTRFNAARVQSKAQKIETFNYIMEMLSTHLHYVIAADNTFDCSAFPDYYIIDICKLNAGIIDKIVEGVHNSPQLHPLVEMLPINIGKILANIHEIVKNRFPFVNVSNFIDFKNTFIQFAREQYDKFKNRKAECQSAIEFIKNLEQKSKSIEKRMTEIERDLEMLKESETFSQSDYANKKDEAMMKINHLEEEGRVKTAELNQIKSQYTQQTEFYEETQKSFQESRENLFSITSKDLEEFRNYAISNLEQIISTTFQLICMLMGRQPSLDNADKKLLLDENLITTVKEGFSNYTPSKEVLDMCRPLFDAISVINDQTAISISPVLHKLMKFGITAFTTLSTKLKTSLLKEELDNKVKGLEEFEKACNIEKKELQNEIERIEDGMKLFQTSLEKKEALDKELEECTNNKQSTDAILKGLDKLQYEWSDDLKSVETRMNLLIGDSLMISAYIVYFGMMNNEDRKDRIIQILEAVRNSKVQINLEPTELISTTLKETLIDVKTTDKDFFPLDAEEDIAHIFLAPKTPLIISPDDSIFSILKRGINKQKAKVVSIISSNFTDVLKDSIKKNIILIVRDVNYLTPILRKVLPYCGLNKGQTVNIKGEIIKVNPKFKLLLFTSLINDVSQVPYDLYCHVSVINTNDSTLSSCSTLLGWKLINYFDSELIPRMQSMEWAEKQNKAEILKYEQETLEIIKTIVNRTIEDSNYDFTNDSETASSIMRAKECYFAATKFTSDISAINNEIDVTLESYKDHTKMLVAMWTALSRYMPKLSKGYHYTFEQFLKCVETGLQASELTSGILTIAQLNSLYSIFIKTILKQYLPTMTYQDGFFFLFISGFLIQEKSNKVHMKDLQIIVEHIIEEYDNKCDLRTVDQSRGDPIDQLKFSNIANIFPFMSKFVSDVFGLDFTSYFQTFSIESFAGDKNLILKCSPSDNPTILLENFISMRGRNKKFTSISLTKESLQNSYTKLSKSKEKGLYTAIHYMEPCPECGAFINKLIGQKNEQNSFHFVIICTDTSYIPVDVQNSTVSLVYDNFPLVKIQMNQLYQHLVQTYEIKSKLVKKLIYGTCLVYSTIKYASIISPMGVSSPSLLSEEDIKAVISLLLPHQNSDINIRNYRQIIKDLVFLIPYVDLNDRRKVENIVFSIIGPDFNEDNFSFVDSSAHDLDKWIISNDSAHALERLPLFNAISALGMSPSIATSLLYFNLSKWIGKPFFSLMNESEENISASNDQINQLLKSLPKKIKVKNNAESPISLFLASEIERINHLIETIRDEIKADKESFTVMLSKGALPEKWVKIIGYNATRNLKKFMENFIERASFYSKWCTTGIIPKSINASHVTNIKGLLNAYRNEIALQRQTTAGNLSYEFRIGDSKENISGFSITGAVLVGANWDSATSKLILPNAKTLAVSKPCSIFCALIKTDSKNVHVFSCPVYKDPPSKQNSIDYMSGNIICNAHLQTELSDKVLISNGVSIILQPPDYFV